MNLSRRDFLINGTLAAGLLPALQKEAVAIPAAHAASDLKVNIFSKHLQFLNYTDMAGQGRKPVAIELYAAASHGG